MIIDYNIHEDYAILDNYVSLGLVGVYNTRVRPLYMLYTMVCKFYNEATVKAELDLTLNVDSKFTNESTLKTELDLNLNVDNKFYNEVTLYG